LAPGGGPLPTENRRHLRLPKPDVRHRERTLERQAGPNEIAALRERGVAIEHEDRRDDRERYPAGPTGDVAARGDAVAIGRWLVAGGGSSRGEDPTRDPGELGRPAETDERVQSEERDDRD